MKKKKLKNYGLRIEEIKPEDYVFGGLTKVPKEELQPDGDWKSYLPFEEKQNLHFETWNCVAFTILNCIEALIKRKYGLERNYSDRFLGAISGTKEGGNSPQIVCEFLRKVGVVPEEIWPCDIDSFNKYYEPIPPKLYELAKEFNEEWNFKHEYVPSVNEEIKEALKSSPLGISVYAWSKRGDRYYKPDGVVDNHFTTLISMGGYKEVFDSYDSFIKEYELDTKHSVIKRFYVERRPAQLTWFQRLIQWVKKWF